MSFVLFISKGNTSLHGDVLFPLTYKSPKLKNRNTVSNAHKMIPPLPHVLYGKVLVLLWETP